MLGFLPAVNCWAIIGRPLSLTHAESWSTDERLGAATESIICDFSMGQKPTINTQALILLVVVVMPFAGCDRGGDQSGNIPAVSEASLRNGKDDAAIKELQALYRAEKTEHGRRAIALRAVDAGLVRRDARLFTIDQVFGTHFEAKITSPRFWGFKSDRILFADQPAAPTPKGDIAVAIGDVGWYMVVEYSSSGVVQNFYLSTLHKGLSIRGDREVSISTEELRRLYFTARSETERRDVCLRAIDEGVIQTFGPVKVGTVDALFGTQFSSNLPPDAESRQGIIDFADSPSPASKGAYGWYLAVGYFSDGSISNYYVSKVKEDF